jgi:hypothetical protein
MDTLYFTFQGKRYSGHIISNKDRADDYYWFVFNDDELIELFGDSVAFQVRKGVAQPVYTYSRFADLILQLQTLVQQYGVNRITQ